MERQFNKTGEIIHDVNEKFSKVIKIFLKRTKQKSELKNSIIKIKNVAKSLQSRKEERISEII
jgi:hypothetical protein